MKCNQCKTEFEGRFCPNCGSEAFGINSASSTTDQQSQQTYYSPQNQTVSNNPMPMKKKKKPIYKRWWFIVIVVIALIAISGKVADYVKDNKKIVWSDMVLGDILPEPPKDRGVIHNNTSEELWVDINNISDKQYTDYVADCKEMGFTIDEDSQSMYFNAYNDKGNKLNLSYNESEKSMKIDVSAPMEFSEISWPKSVAGKMLPVPKSLTGSFSYEQEDGFSVYISNTTINDFNEYISDCFDYGFNINYDKSEKYYSADNAEGWHITVKYEGFNIMNICIDAPDESDNSAATEASSNSQTSSNESSVKSDMDSADIDPDFKAAMDSYEEFIDEYVEFMKKYKESDGKDVSLLSDYADYMRKYTEFAEDFEKWENEELTTAETAYYIEVQARVSQKLLEVSE